MILRQLLISDINAVVKIHQEGFPQSRSTKLGKRFLRKMYRWYITYHPRLAFGAELDGQLIGFIVGSLGNTSSERTRYLLGEILLGFARHPMLLSNMKMFNSWQSFARDLLPKQNHSPQTKHDKVIINTLKTKAALDSIAVSSTVRKKNIGRSLMQAFEDSAEQLGATFMVLGVEYNNVPARALYEKCGWGLINENINDNSANYQKRLTPG